MHPGASPAQPRRHDARLRLSGSSSLLASSARRRDGAWRRATVLAAVALGSALLVAILPAGIAGATTGTSVSITTPGTSTYWSPVSVGVTVTADSGPNPTSGSVTVTDSSTFGDFDCTLTLQGSDQASCPGTYSSVGTDTITAAYGGGGGYAPASGSVGVSVAQASVTLSVNATAVTVGETTTVTVTPSPGLGADSSGTLSMSDQGGALDCSTTLSGDEAQCTSTRLTTAGNDVIDVAWAGNADYEPATGTTTLDVGQATTVVASITAPASQVGSTATITVQVQPVPDGGDVALSDADGEVNGCGALVVSTTTGRATCTTGILTAADPTDKLSASYLGDADYAASGTTTGTLEIDRGTTQLALSADPSPAVGSAATFVATVSPAPAGQAGGTISFSDSASPAEISDCSNEPVDTATGQASCTSLTYSSAGSDTVTASFGGSTNWATSSARQSFTVSPDTPSVSVTLAPAEPTVGESVVVTAVASPSDGGGTVDFSGSYLSGCSGVALSGNAARCTSSTLTATGQWTVQAAYSGDTNYNPVTVSTTITIGAALTTTTLTSDPASPVAFSTATLTAAVAPVPDGGTVGFSDAGGPLSGCSAVAVSTSTGEAACTVARLPGAGIDGLTASYSGVTDYQSSSGELQLLVAKVPTTLSVTPSPDPVPAGQGATLTITVSPVPDGGTVSVTDSYGELGCAGVTVPTSGPSAGTATCTTGALSPAGTDGLSGSYTGSADDTAASATGSITVSRIPSTIVVKDADSYAQVGSQLHLVVAVSPPPAAGTVQFSDSLGELASCASVGVDPVSGLAGCVSGTLTVTGSDVITATFLQTPTEASSHLVTPIPVEQAPTFTGSLAATVTVGAASAVQLAVAGYPAPVVAAGAPLPGGLQLSAAGAITGTPAPGTGGGYAVPLSATNALAASEATLDLVVDQAPAIATATSLTAAYGVPTSFTIRAAAGTYPLPGYSLAGALPAGMSFTDNGDGTATIAGAPGAGGSGAQGFAVVATNAAGSVRVLFSIEVTGVPAPAGGAGTGPPPAPPATGSGSGAGATPLSPVAEALAARRAAVVPSTGVRPRLGGHVALAGTYDPIAMLRTVRRDGRTVRLPVVVLGRDRGFPTLGNVGPYGDCAVVAVSDIVRVDHLAGRFGHVPKMTADEALSEWGALDGGSGAGLTDAQLLHAWSGSAGVLGTRLRGWTALDASSIPALERAIVATGALYATIVVPDDVALSETIDPPISASSPVAGHSLALIGWTPHGFLVVTWGEVALVPYRWWSRYAATAYAVNLVGGRAGASR